MLHCQLAGGADQLVKLAARYEVVDFTSAPADLDALFLHYYEGRRRRWRSWSLNGRCAIAAAGSSGGRSASRAYVVLQTSFYPSVQSRSSSGRSPSYPKELKAFFGGRAVVRLLHRPRATSTSSCSRWSSRHC